MGGFFGTVSNAPCVEDIYYGTDYHSHLGTRRGGMAMSGRDGVIKRRIHDISNTPFRTKFGAESLAVFENCTSGIGVISDDEDQPLVITSKFGTFAIVTVGKINNTAEILQQEMADGRAHLAEYSFSGEPNPSEVAAMLICRKSSIAEGIAHAQQVIDGSLSLLVLHEGAIYAARDFFGRTPVILGVRCDENGAVNARAVTMESSAFPNLDFETECELGPGEIRKITSSGTTVLKAPEKCMKICTFFWVYYGYPSSCYEGMNTESARYRNGASMADQDEEFKGSIDSVCGIPDSGIPHAIGYANRFGRPYHRAFVKYTPTWARSFMPPNQSMRERVAKMKLIPVESQIAGKKLLFCDDSIVRGTQLGDTVKRIYQKGAVEVHMRSSCPPLLYGCRFLNFSRSRNEHELAARQAISELEGTAELTPEILKKYQIHGSKEYIAMVNIIRKKLNFTTLKFQELDRLLEAIGIPKENLCTYCWNGCDPSLCGKNKEGK
ncbi:MAG: amidophosphoribosyltransferase [Lentisphaeria bacterium]|nr:amidophosphoribosyltransferase [Lentisphaeria bacterium]